MKLPAQRIKGGDTIRHGRITGEVFDTLRPAFGGGYYLPLVDGRRVTVACTKTKIRLI